MKQKYRWLFGALALIVSASILFGCKPNIHLSSEAAKITVTVQGDEQVTVQEPKTFQVDKESVWKTVKEKVKVTYTVGYELSNWKLGNKEGTALTDAHVFTENTTVYAVSKPKGSIAYPVQYDRLKDYLNSPTDPPAADGVYYIEVTGLTNTDLKSSSWGTPSPLGEILKNCGKKVALKLSGAITVIGEHAFSGCTGLTNITIPNSVTAISECAFYGCLNLSNITIKSTGLTDIAPDSFKEIKDDARFTVKTEAIKTLLHTQGYIAEDRITVNPSL